MYGINFGEKYKKCVRPFGLEDQVFKESKYYDIPYSENPKLIETELLANKVEPLYEEIISVVGTNKPITEELLKIITVWMYFSDMRKPSLRESFQNTSELMLTSIVHQRNGFRTNELDERIESLSIQAGIKSQLDLLAKPKMLKNVMDIFLEVLSKKRWRFLSAAEGFTFWTSDNPGFSVNTNSQTASITPYFDLLEMNEKSINYYPLSPYLCLEITPNAESDKDDMLGSYGYGQATPETMNFINKGVILTRNQIVIANNRKELEECIKWG